MSTPTVRKGPLARLRLSSHTEFTLNRSPQSGRLPDGRGSRSVVTASPEAGFPEVRKPSGVRRAVDFSEAAFMRVNAGENEPQAPRWRARATRSATTLSSGLPVVS